VRIATVALLLAAAGGASSAEVVVSPQASGEEVRLRGITAVDADVAWASGREGTVLRTVDGGAHWQAVPVPGAAALDFRDIEAFDADTAVVLAIGPGEASRVYRTSDGGRSWTETLRNSDPRAFLDCMAFEGERGWILGDPVDGRFQVLASEDGGRSWELQDRALMVDALPDEAAFAASGTCIATTPWDGRLVVTGGAAARVLAQSSGAGAWRAHDTPVESRIPAAGLFSAAAVGDDMLLVGGDFEHEGRGAAALAQYDAADGLRVSALPQPHGYRSGVACFAGEAPLCVAVGPNGVDLLRQGRWQALSATGYDAVDVTGKVAWASGDKGRIARIDLTSPAGPP
jgi:photosystem II stability/assembly factor-like uncharacterized protein